MKLLYRMHLPPALPLQELQELSNNDVDSYDVVESAGEQLLSFNMTSIAFCCRLNITTLKLTQM